MDHDGAQRVEQGYGRPARLLYRITEAAQLLGLGRSTVYELIRARELYPVVRVGRSVRISAAALSAYVARQEERATTEER